MPDGRPLPRTLAELRHALGEGQRHFPGLRLFDLDGVDLDLSHCVLRGGCLREARFGRASLAQAEVERCAFHRSLLWGADLSGLRGGGSYWQEADLSGSKLQAADFSSAHLHRACLRGVLAAGSRWNQARLVESDFRSGLDQLTDLGQASFLGADLSFALFQGANLQQADLRGAALYGANFSRADLRGADLRAQDLRECQLQGALLEGALLEEAHLPEEFNF